MQAFGGFGLAAVLSCMVLCFCNVQDPIIFPIGVSYLPKLRVLLLEGNEFFQVDPKSIPVLSKTDNIDDLATEVTQTIMALQRQQRRILQSMTNWDKIKVLVVGEENVCFFGFIDFRWGRRSLLLV